MSNKRKIEIFSAGCPACEEACPSCEMEVLDMHHSDVAARAAQLGINRLPAIVIDGALAGCCAAGAVDEKILRAAGVGVPLA